ncbi:hypothetical protein Tco_0592439 [Tanacetum coccineum]
MASPASSIFIFIVKSLQFEHSAFPRLSAAQEGPEEELAPKQEIRGVEGPEKELAFQKSQMVFVEQEQDEYVKDIEDRRILVTTYSNGLRSTNGDFLPIFVNEKGKGLQKDDKGKLTGIKSVDDLEKRIQNVKEVLYKGKEEMLMKKLKQGQALKVFQLKNLLELRSSLKDLQADVGASAGSLTLLVLTKRPPLIRNCILGLLAVRNWGLILNKEFGIRKPKEDVESSTDVAGKGKEDGVGPVCVC